MAEWQQWDPSSLYPTDLANLLSDIEPVVSTLGTALGVAATILEVAGLFVQGFTDINAAIIGSLIDLINSAIQSLTQTGIYALFHVPNSPLINSDPTQWLSDVSYSLQDLMDDRRPILIDPGAYVGAIVLMGTANSFTELWTKLGPFLALFNRLMLTDTQLANMLEPGDAIPAPVRGVGRDPNWDSIKLAEMIPPINTIVGELVKFQSWVEPAASGSSIYQSFADLLKNKSDALSAFAQTILDVLDVLSGLLSISGMWLLPVYGQGDYTWFRRQLMGSTGGPRETSDNYAAGAVFLATGGTSTPIDVMFDLFGVPKVVTEVAAEFQEIV